MSLYAKDVVKFAQVFLSSLGGERTAPRTLEFAGEHPQALEERNKDMIQASFFRAGFGPDVATRGMQPHGPRHARTDGVALAKRSFAAALARSLHASTFSIIWTSG